MSKNLDDGGWGRPIELTPVTGLPEVPPNHFWRVREGSFHMDKLELRKRFGPFSTLVMSRTLAFYVSSRDGRSSSMRLPVNPREEIIRKAQSIMYEFADSWKPYYGDYPPKTLDTTKETE